MVGKTSNLAATTTQCDIRLLAHIIEIFAGSRTQLLAQQLTDYRFIKLVIPVQ